MPPWAARLKRAHYNLMENIPLFVIAVIAGELRGIHTGVARLRHGFLLGTRGASTRGAFQHLWHTHGGLHRRLGGGSRLSVCGADFLAGTGERRRRERVNRFLDRLKQHGRLERLIQGLDGADLRRHGVEVRHLQLQLPSMKPETAITVMAG